MSGRTPEERREDLVRLYEQVCEGCCCGLGATRTRPVFGMGNANADLMFVGEAPGAEEDRTGRPFVGRAGKLLDQLLGEVGMERSRDAFIANTLKCLRYNAQVQLADGSWERIGRLVRSRYAGEVMSVDSAGRIVPRRVVGWHATPLAGRRVFRLTYRSAKRAGAGRVGIELTGDHPVLTERGYVAVQDLRSNDRIAVGQGISILERDVVCGTLLGDGHLGTQSSYLSIAHSHRQREHALFKAKLLSALEPRVEERLVSGRTGGRAEHAVVMMRTLAHRALRVLRHDFYPAGKAVPAWIVAATPALSERIAPYVPPTMRYKLHPDVERAIPFDPAAFDNGPPVTMYDEVEVTEVSDRPRGDTTFFCIDVEETHNFVTAGGVVHNCRPPGNRDPQPDEIAACRPYLDRQIELIEPLVICTLGNFSTKLLTGSPVGITRCCGTPQDHELGGRQLVIYPLFHPAAALRTPSVLERLRADFARIPALLERERGRARERAGGAGSPDQRPSALAAMAASLGSRGEPDPGDEPPPQLGLFGPA